MTDHRAAAAGGLQFGFVKINVTDMAKVARFYKDAFGFREQNHIDLPSVEELALTMPDNPFRLVLLRYKDGRQLQLGSAWGPLGFVSNDLKASIAQLTAQGAASCCRRPRLPFPATRSSSTRKGMRSSSSNSSSVR